MMVNTIHGEMDESLLEKKVGAIDTQNETTSWVEYWLNGEMVHRSVHVTLKEGAISATLAGVFG